jgi:hypothetical protein
VKCIKDLQFEVNRVNHFFERERMEHQHSKAGIFPSGDATPFSAGVDVGSSMHRTTGQHRDLEWSTPQDPGTSTTSLAFRHGDVVFETRHGRAVGSGGDFGRFGQGRLPKLNFPSFTGDDPQLWKSHFENYFEMYGVQSPLWIKVATMHFEGATAHWFRSNERRVRDVSWCMSDLVGISMRLSLVNGSISSRWGQFLNMWSSSQLWWISWWHMSLMLTLFTMLFDLWME